MPHTAQFPKISVSFTVSNGEHVEHVGHFEPSDNNERTAWWERALQALADGREITIRKSPRSTNFGSKLRRAINKSGSDH